MTLWLTPAQEGVNLKPVARLRKREAVEDMESGSVETRLTVLTEAKAALIVALVLYAFAAGRRLLASRLIDRHCIGA